MRSRGLRGLLRVVAVAAILAAALQSREAQGDFAAALAKLENVHKIAITPEGREVWAYGAHSATIAIARVGDGFDKVDGAIELPYDNRAPTSEIVFSPDGHLAYLAETPQYCDDGTGFVACPKKIVVIDALAREIVALVPVPDPWGPIESVAISPDGGRLYLVVADFDGGREGICIFDTRARSIAGVVELPGVRHLAVSRDGTKLFCARGSSFIGPSPNLLSVVDTSSWQVLFSVPTGTSPCWVAVTPDEITAVVPNAGSADVTLVDLQAHAVSATVPLGVVPHTVVVTPDGAKAYVGMLGTISVYASADSVPVIDLKSRKVKTYISTGVEPQSVAMDPAGERIYVSDGNANGLQPAEFHVVDAENDAYLKRIVLRPAALYTPTGIDVVPDGSRAFVIAEGRGTLVVLDVANGRVQAELPLRPRAVAASGNGSRVYVFSPHYQKHGDGRLFILDARTLSLLDAIALSDTSDLDSWDSVVDRIVLDKAEHIAYLTCGERVQVLAVDLVGRRVKGTVAIATSGRNVPARGLALAPDGRTLYVTDTMTQQLAVVDANSLQVTSRVAVGNSPSAVALSQDGRRIYVLHQHSSQAMSIIDSVTLGLVRTVPFGWTVAGELNFLLSADERLVTIPCFDPNWVMVFDIEETNPVREIKALIKTGLDPFNQAATADGTRLFVTNFTSDTVTIIDRLTNTIFRTIPLASGPHSVRRHLRRS